MWSARCQFRETLMICERTLTRLALGISHAGALELRAVPEKVTNDQVEHLPINKRPFLYSTGNWGPGYLMIR